MKEIEVRAKLEKDEYEELLERLKKELPDFKVETHLTFHSVKDEKDIRIRLFNDDYYMLTLKEGTMSDNVREEIEFRFDKSEINSVIDFLKSFGFDDFVKWEKPARHKFKKNGISIDLDDISGFGYFVEFEKVTDEDETVVIEELREMLNSYNLEEIPLETYLHEVEEYMLKNKVDLQ
jgi:predicted adenylyl cyclase CyaB